MRRGELAGVLGSAGLVAVIVALAGLTLAPAGAEGDPTPPAAEVTNLSGSTTEPTDAETTEPTEATELSDVEPTETAPTEPGPTGPTPTDPTPTDFEPTDPGPTEPAEDVFEVDDAVLRWGLNNESNTQAYAPGTYNFFSAGRLPDPGRGGQTIAQGQWRRAAGDVAIEKWDAGAGSWRPATWAGLATDSDGNPLRTGTFSNHNLVFTGGAGEVDQAAGTATVAWDGDATVLYYSGMSFFYISDPVLTVANGRGVLTAVLSGFGSSLADPSLWVPVPEKRVRIATLPEVDLADAAGFVVEPSYLGVRVDVADGAQVRSGPVWGSFPQPFVAFMERMGTASYWYSSGGAADPNKVPLPLTVSYSAADPVTQTPDEPSDVPTVENTAPPPPAGQAPPAAAPPLQAPAQAPVAAAPLAALLENDAMSVLNRPGTELRSTSAATATLAAAGPSPGSWPWWGAGLLLMAAAVLLLASPRKRF